MYYIYKHLDKNDAIIYVGQTVDMEQRQLQHKGTSSHRKEIKKIIYAEVPNKTLMDIYEQYYINKDNPKCNISKKRGDDVSFLGNVNELEFKEFKIDVKVIKAKLRNKKYKENLTKRIIGLEKKVKFWENRYIDNVMTTTMRDNIIERWWLDRLLFLQRNYGKLEMIQIDITLDSFRKEMKHIHTQKIEYRKSVLDRRTEKFMIVECDID